MGARPSTGPGTDSAPLAIPADDAAAVGGIREHFADGIRGLRRSLPFRALLSTFVLQALATGLMLAGAQYVATWVLHSEQAVTYLFVALIAPALFAAPAWGVVARRIGKERTFSIVERDLRARRPLDPRHAVGARRLDLHPGRRRRRRVRGHAVAADVDAPRRDLARRAHQRTRPGRLVQRCLDRR